MPRHGEIRKQRLEVLSSTAQTLVDAAGNEFSITGSSHERTVSERWCDTCGAWVEAGRESFIDFFLCPECQTPWS
jgi:hypothetical protein